MIHFVTDLADPRLEDYRDIKDARLAEASGKFVAESELVVRKLLASGLRVPSAIGDFMILDAVRESGGRAIAGREERIAAWMARVAATEGICICPETAVCFDCIEQLTRQGDIHPHEVIVVFNTGAAQKYPDILPLDLPRIEKNAPFRP